MTSDQELIFPDNTRRPINLSEKDILQDELIITAKASSEERANQPLWRLITEKDEDRVLYLAVQGSESCDAFKGEKLVKSFQLRDMNALAELINEQRILIDVTGLSHDVWGPLLRYAFSSDKTLRVLYSEPSTYTIKRAPSSESIFDLSVEIGGIKPLPGFAKIRNERKYDMQLLVALLGFEGDRPLRVALNFDPVPKIVPIVGMPGFQLDFPAYTVSCNRKLLKEYSLHSEMRYARASCPFGVYRVLEEIHEDNPGCYMNIAMVGTKPHAIGAVMYALENQESTELIFDHPVRKSGRTQGVGQIHIYNLSDHA